MNDMDDLENIADGLKADRCENLRKGRGIYVLQRINNEKSRQKSLNSLRMSAYEPSLPKLKFLEGKDE